MAQAAQPPQHGGCKSACQRAVAIRQTADTGMGCFTGQLLVERKLAAQHAVQHVSGDAARGKAWNFGLGQRSRARHSTVLARNVSVARWLFSDAFPGRKICLRESHALG